jgi:hypothetical protein
VTNLNPKSRTISYCGISANSPYQPTSKSSYYLRFNVSIRFNNLNSQYNTKQFTDNSFQFYKLVKSLRDEGLSYRRVSKYLNDRNILTPKNKEWSISGSSVYSVIKRYRERVERLSYLGAFFVNQGDLHINQLGVGSTERRCMSLCKCRDRNIVSN